MKIAKPQLFLTHKSFVLTILFFTFLLFVRLGLIYSDYQEFTTKPFYFTYTNVISIEDKPKAKYPYKLLKLQSDDGLEFYTKSYEPMPIETKRVRVEIFPDSNITFFRFLGAFFVDSKLKEIVPVENSFKDNIIENIKNQHKDNITSSIYPAIFFNTPLSKDIRDKVIVLGASHLIALSGFNLSILWGVVFGVLAIIYKPLQSRFFPHRYSIIDLGLISLLFLGVYVYFTDFSPSLIRAYAMVLFGWMILVMGLELVSFSFLAFIVSVLLVIYPKFLVSISFWFSVAGVFYVMLVAYHTKNINKYLVGFVIMPISMFLLMQPIVHAIFGQTSPYQLLSIPLELVYVLFYPVMMFLHTIGFGGLIDGWLIWLLNFAPSELKDSIFPLYLLILYVFLSIASIFNRYLFLILLVLSFGYLVYIFTLI
ncbi:MAG: ComEC/Rec2 family competence protein [Sulfurovaceae bacterium]|nr:ComEC/Rec2 family competence protein [Sulfurovaceae bacterium]MDD5548602.1 ComEC/Rec2 family competence protein [Sulfurovaceae bacterium]